MFDSPIDHLASYAAYRRNRRFISQS